MDRRKFLKLLGVGTSLIPALPALALEKQKALEGEVVKDDIGTAYQPLVASACFVPQFYGISGTIVGFAGSNTLQLKDRLAALKAKHNGDWRKEFYRS